MTKVGIVDLLPEREFVDKYHSTLAGTKINGLS